MSTAVLEMTTEMARVVLAALLKASEELEISRSMLAQILGVSAPSVTRMFQGQFEFNEKSKEFEHALLFIRMYLALADLIGEPQNRIIWLNGENFALGSRPFELLGSTEGLVRVVGYLEATSSR
jgi:hypothetical protein